MAEVETMDDGWEKTDGVTIMANYWMEVDGPGGVAQALDNMFERPVKGTTDWKQYEVVLDVPADAQWIRFGPYLGGSGQAWFDDVKLEVVGNDVPVTDMLITASVDWRDEWQDMIHMPSTIEALKKKAESLEAQRNTIPLQPLNLDFEQ